MVSSTKGTVGGVGASGGVVTKGQTFAALGVWSKGKVFLNFELFAEKGEAR